MRFKRSDKVRVKSFDAIVINPVYKYPYTPKEENIQGYRVSIKDGRKESFWVFLPKELIEPQ